MEASPIASPGSEVSPAAESLYGFANRLHPITPTGPHAHQFAMPQSYPQNRNGYMSSTVARPTSAQGKRGGRRPKEYEEYVRSDHVTLSEEEKDKRDKRRLRNKEAAARCRQRRLDLMGSLQNQVDQLREENKAKDSKIAELQLLKHELIAVIREHQCVLPDSLRQSLDIDMSSTQQYMPRATAQTMGNDIPQFSNPQSQPPLMNNRKRPAGELIPELRQQPSQPMHAPPSSMPLNNNNNQANIVSKPPVVQIKQEPSFKQEPTLYDVNGRGEDEEMKRPTSLSFSESSIVTTANYLSSSGVTITTPSNLLGSGATDFGTVNLLDAPTGLTPCHPPQATAFPLSSMTTPLGEGRNFETL